MSFREFKETIEENDLGMSNCLIILYLFSYRFFVDNKIEQTTLVFAQVFKKIPSLLASVVDPE